VNPGLYRAINTLLFIGAGIVLGLSSGLEPDPLGVGTHTQLGLKGCIVLSQWGIPCPMCGMTTTFALMADFKWIAAIKNQPFGVLLYLMTVLTAIISAIELTRSRSIWFRLSKRIGGIEVKLVTVFFLFLVISWGYKLVSMRIFLLDGA
jgi:hypothetical protein